MADQPMNKLHRLLVMEGGFTQELAQTMPAKQLQDVRASMATYVQGVAKRGDLGLIIATEKAIVAGDLERYANSADMTKSLGTALNELAVIERHLALVADPGQYRTVNETHSLPKNRRGGLPRDEARQAMASHHTRLGNMDKSRLTAEEKNVIEARKASLKVGANLYAKMQAKAIGTDGPVPKRKGLGLSL